LKNNLSREGVEVMYAGFTNVDMHNKDVIFDNLKREEDFIRQFLNSQPMSNIMPSLKALHQIMSELIGLFKRKKESRNEILKWDNIIQTLGTVTTSNTIDGLKICLDDLSPLILFSEEVELFRAAWKYAKDKQGCSDVQISSFMNPTDAKNFPLLVNILNYIFAMNGLDHYKDRLRVRKQKSTRNFETVKRMVGELQGGLGVTLNSFHLEFYCPLEHLGSKDIYAFNTLKDDFLKRIHYIFRNQLSYIWFLEYERHKGYGIFFVFLYKEQVNFVEIYKMWNELTNVPTNPNLFDPQQSLIGHRYQFLLNGTNKEKFLECMSYLCFREMYYKTNFESIKTFGRSTKLINRKIYTHNSMVNSGVMVNFPSLYSSAMPYYRHYTPPAMAPVYTPALATSNIMPQTPMGPTFLDAPEFKARYKQAEPIKKEFHVTLATNNQYGSYLVHWQPEQAVNPFLLITGQSGSGKTNTLMLIASQASDFVPVWMFDPHNSMKLLGFERVLFSSGSDSKLGVNPLAIYSDDFGRKGLHDHIQAVIDVVKRAARNLGLRQTSILQEAFESLYSRIDSQHQNDQSDVHTPTFEDVAKLLSQQINDPDKKSKKHMIEGCLATIRTIFGNPVFNRTENFDVKESIHKRIYFDVSALPDAERFILMESLLRHSFDLLSQQPPDPQNPKKVKLMIIIDEARLLTMMGKEKDRDDSNRMINVIVNEGRKFGISLVLASQRFDHFSKDIHVNVGAKIIHKVIDFKEARAIARNINIDAEFLMRLKAPKEAVFYDGNQPRFISVDHYLNLDKSIEL